MMRCASLVAVAVLLLTGPPAAGQQACTVHPPVPGAGLGEPVLLNFGPDNTIVNVFVQVREGMLRPFVAGTFALDITITSIDGINHFHGTDVILLSKATPVGQDDDIATLALSWTADDEPQVVGDLYTVCSQLVAGGPAGPERCIDFGPFF